MGWRLFQAGIVLALVASCLIGLGMVAGLGWGVVTVVQAVVPKPPVATIYLSSPDDEGWKSEIAFSATLHKPVILQRVPDGIRRIEVRYQIPMSGNDRLLCDQNKPSGLGETFTRREERSADSTKLFQVVGVTVPGRGGVAELYAANVMLNFCGVDGYFRSESRWTYYLGFWYGTEAGFDSAVKHLGAKSASELQVTPP